MQPVILRHAFRLPVPTPDIVARISAELEADPRAKRVAGSDTFRSGSRFGFRMWGLWGPGARRRLPALWTITAADTAVVLEFRSDEGPYLVRLPQVNTAYERALAHVAARVETALNP